MPILLSNDFTHEFSMLGTNLNLPDLHDGGSNAKSDSQKGPQQESRKESEKEDEGAKGSRIMGLDCKPWGGPPNEHAAEMVYWEDIPDDSKHVSPFYNPDVPPQYFSFEMDFAGWNNVR